MFRKSDRALGCGGNGPVGVEYGGGPFRTDHPEGETMLEAPDHNGLGLGLGPSWVGRMFNGEGREAEIIVIHLTYLTLEI